MLRVSAPCAYRGRVRPSPPLPPPPLRHHHHTHSLSHDVKASPLSARSGTNCCNTGKPVPSSERKSAQLLSRLLTLSRTSLVLEHRRCAHSTLFWVAMYGASPWGLHLDSVHKQLPRPRPSPLRHAKDRDAMRSSGVPQGLFLFVVLVCQVPPQWLRLLWHVHILQARLSCAAK